MGTHEGAPYLVSELLEGETLRELIKRGRIALRKVKRGRGPQDDLWLISTSGLPVTHPQSHTELQTLIPTDCAPVFVSEHPIPQANGPAHQAHCYRLQNQPLCCLSIGI
jgi:hypothetical protein